MTMEATAYGLTAQDNYPYGATDYFGQPLTAGDIAVDPSVIPLGTCLYVTGYSSPYLPQGGFIGEADDTGGAIKGAHIDIFENLNNESQISAFGIQHVQVTILGKSPDSPSQASGSAACSMFSKPGGQAGSGGSGGSGGSAGAGSASSSQGGSQSGGGSAGAGGGSASNGGGSQGGSNGSGGGSPPGGGSGSSAGGSSGSGSQSGTGGSSTGHRYRYRHHYRFHDHGHWHHDWRAERHRRHRA